MLYGQSVKEQPRNLSTAAAGADLAAALAGDAEAFRRLTDPYTRELHLHCYRMLGSVHDAEDAMQETLLRAWRHLATYEGRSSFRAWLYRIATNVCLRQRPRRRTDPSSLPRALAEAVARGAEPAISLSPYPDAWLDELEAPSGDPAADYDLRESVQLAFLAAVQLLPPRQRAALILRDVLGWSAGEVARSLARRYVEAWQAVDIDALTGLLTSDVVMTMPPLPVRYTGREAVTAFLATIPAGGDRDRFRFIPTRANRQPALAVYRRDPDGDTYRAWGIFVLSADGAAIAAITAFVDPTLVPVFGLPAELARDAGGLEQR